jgi:hypothetical protein
MLIVCLLLTLPLFIFALLAVWTGIVATIYKIFVNPSKGVIGGEVQTEATREDENFVGCKLSCLVLGDISNYKSWLKRSY